MKPKGTVKRARVAIGYVRGAGPEAQAAAIAAAAKDRGLELRATRREPPDSGGRQAALSEALDQVCEAGGVLIVQSLGVLARSALTCMRACSRLRQGGGDLIVIEQKVDTTSRAGHAFFDTLAALADLELERHRMERRPPFGFDQADDGEHLVLNPAEQGVIRQIVAWNREGWEHQRIAAELNQRKSPARGERGWDAAAIKDVIAHAATSRWTLDE